MKQDIDTPARRLPMQWLPLLILAAALLPVSGYILAAAQGASLHAPRWELWDRITPTLQLHIISALTALVIGTVLMLGAKGRAVHKVLGWAWVVAMVVTAASSLFITGINGDAFSFIHILSGWTLVALPMGVYAIRRRNVEKHRRTMSGMFYGGLLFAGAFTFLPGRFMFEMFFG